MNPAARLVIFPLRLIFQRSNIRDAKCIPSIPVTDCLHFVLAVDLVKVLRLGCLVERSKEFQAGERPTEYALPYTFACVHKHMSIHDCLHVVCIHSRPDQENGAQCKNLNLMGVLSAPNPIGECQLSRHAIFTCDT